MYNAFAAPLRLELKPSRYVRYGLFVLHLTLLAVVPALPNPFYMGLYLGLILLSVLRLRQSPQIQRLVWRSDGFWEIDAEDRFACLAAPPCVYPGLVILRLQWVEWQLSGRCLAPLVILPDSLDEQSFRRLRVRLRFCARDDYPS